MSFLIVAMNAFMCTHVNMLILQACMLCVCVCVSLSVHMHEVDAVDACVWCFCLCKLDMYVHVCVFACLFVPKLSD